MTRAHIQTRVWLSIGIFVLGFLITTIVSGLERMRAEQGLAAIADAVLPAAQSGRDAEAAFERLVKTYSDSIVIGDLSGLDRAALEGRRIVESLRSIGATRAISDQRTSSARRLTRDLTQFLAEAHVAYVGSPSYGVGATPESQGRLQRLALRTTILKEGIDSLANGLASDLQRRMDELRSRSAAMRMFIPYMFVATMGLAITLVNLTIRRSILAPLAKTQDELAHERDLLRILLDHIPDCIYFKDTESRFLRINQAQANLIGVKAPAEALGRSDADYFDAAVFQKTRADEQRILQTGEPLTGSIERITRNGLTWWVTASKVRVRDEAQNTDLIVGISRDMTEWKRTMDELEESEESLRLLFAAIPHAVWVYDVETRRFLKVNEAACRRYGYSAEEFETIGVDDLHPPADASRLREILARLWDCPDQVLPEGAWQHRTRAGDLIEVEIHARMLRFKERPAILAVVQDVTDRKRLELELQTSQRLEAVGHLAAGIAHEVNTPIQFVGDNLHFLDGVFADRQAALEKFDSQIHQGVLAGDTLDSILELWEQAQEASDMEYLATEVPNALQQSLDGVERIATIVRAMKAFAHPGQKEKVAADLNKALADTLTVARNELKYVADVETDFGDLPPVVCHLADLNQVFLNLLVNSAQAIGAVMKESGVKGRIRVKTRTDGDCVTVSISDTGCGIPEAIKSLVFDQFFTTKEVGHGTGQGLALARGIVVEKHGGRIAFEPNLPQGTTFVVSVPIGQPDAVSPDAPRLEESIA
jgi:two-component system, NtrC family, sensor kinase